MKKKLLSILLALSLLLTLLPTVALAADGAWDGSIATAFAGGTGTEGDPYQIADGAQLAYLASEINKGQPYENACFVLTADIDLGNHDWTPIGNSFSDALFGGTDYSVFAGNLDGKGHTVSNISIGTEGAPLESDVFGLFGVTGGKLSNLNLDGVTICGTAKNVSGYVIGLAGALSGSASGPVENCHIANLSMTVSMPDSGMAAAYWIGGLVGALDMKGRQRGKRQRTGMRETNGSTARIGRNVSSRRWNDKDVREQYSIRRNGRGKNILYRYSYRQNQRINSKLSRKTLAFWKICKQTLSCKEAYSEN